MASHLRPLQKDIRPAEPESMAWRGSHSCSNEVQW